MGERGNKETGRETGKKASSVRFRPIPTARQLTYINSLQNFLSLSFLTVPLSLFHLSRFSILPQLFNCYCCCCCCCLFYSAYINIEHKWVNGMLPILLFRVSDSWVNTHKQLYDVQLAFNKRGEKSIETVAISCLIIHCVPLFFHEFFFHLYFSSERVRVHARIRMYQYYTLNRICP